MNKVEAGPYSTCAQVLVRTLNGNGKVIKSSKQMALAHWIPRYRGDLDSISTANMLLNSLEGYDNSIEGCK